jgi:multiple sugar transport system permease protein
MHVGKVSPLELGLRYVGLAIMLLFFMFPIYWLFAGSFKTQVDTFAIPPKWIFMPTLENYIHVLLQTDFVLQARNSLVAALSNVALSMVIGTLAAYAISRFKVGTKNLLYWFLGIRMIPPIVAAIPLFLIAAQLRLIDTPWILPILYLTLNLPFVIWMMKSFIDEIPPDIEESALVDGCSYTGALVRVVVPLAAPGLVATAVFCFIMAWNEFLFSMIFTRANMMTLPVAISGFITEEQIFWGYLTAAACIAAIPPIIFIFVFNRYLVRGLTFGAMK